MAKKPKHEISPEIRSKKLLCDDKVESLARHGSRMVRAGACTEAQALAMIDADEEWLAKTEAILEV
jgi:hypothetical protein